jgi:hypothetical protein
MLLTAFVSLLLPTLVVAGLAHRTQASPAFADPVAARGFGRECGLTARFGDHRIRESGS